MVGSEGPSDRNRHDAGGQDAGRGRRDGRKERAVRGGRGRNAPFEDASFGVIISNGVIDLVPDKEAVFAEIRRSFVRAVVSRWPT